MEPSLCIEDLMELKCTQIIGDSIQLIPFENTFSEEPAVEEGKKAVITDDSAFRKMRRSLVGRPIHGTDGRFGCPHCEKTFSQKYIVPRHIRSMHLDHYTECGECGDQVKNLRQHMKNKHRGNQRVKCVICEAGMDTKREVS